MKWTYESDDAHECGRVGVKREPFLFSNITCRLNKKEQTCDWSFHGIQNSWRQSDCSVRGEEDWTEEQVVEEIKKRKRWDKDDKTLFINKSLEMITRSPELHQLNLKGKSSKAQQHKAFYIKTAIKEKKKWITLIHDDDLHTWRRYINVITSETSEQSQSNINKQLWWILF